MPCPHVTPLRPPLRPCPCRQLLRHVAPAIGPDAFRAAGLEAALGDAMSHLCTLCTPPPQLLRHVAPAIGPEAFRAAGLEAALGDVIAAWGTDGERDRRARACSALRLLPADNGIKI